MPVKNKTMPRSWLLVVVIPYQGMMKDWARRLSMNPIAVPPRTSAQDCREVCLDLVALGDEAADGGGCAAVDK